MHGRVADVMITCDKCLAQAQMSYLASDGGVLVLCGHHSAQYGPALASSLSYPVVTVELWPPRGWEACGYGLPVNGPDRHHSEHDREDLS